MSRLKKALQDGRFVVTGKIGPPKGVDLATCLDDAEKIKESVTAFNVTDLQSAVLRIGSLAVSARFVDKGMEPVYQLTCRDRNRLALQADLLGAWALGIENVLCLTGDHPILGDHAEAKAVFDLDSVQLLKTADALNNGADMAGHELDSSPDFFLGAVVTPGSVPLEPQVIKMKKKIEAGARFFQTQAVYDPGQFIEFMDRVKPLKVPVMAGIVILKSAAMARYMNANVAGVNVPDSLINELDKTPKEERKAKAVEVTVDLIRQIQPYCQGVHLMAMGWEDLVPKIIEKSGLAS